MSDLFSTLKAHCRWPLQIILQMHLEIYVDFIKNHSMWKSVIVCLNESRFMHLYRSILWSNGFFPVSKHCYCMGVRSKRPQVKTALSPPVKTAPSPPVKTAPANFVSQNACVYKISSWWNTRNGLYLLLWDCIIRLLGFSKCQKFTICEPLPLSAWSME